MTEHSTLLTLLLITLDTDCPQMPFVGQLRTQTNADAKISTSTNLCE